eukprot:TRINITY_DN1487_c0_g1_i1.p2 TRINITY_DN1487_c0_g1~~TRINITY_DN1487_c0_g1_i1.p2  ORF type:complete len:123 (-),score=1.84 TRINITY_DN1487_c0_g1_i1:231-599(-)
MSEVISRTSLLNGAFRRSNSTPAGPFDCNLLISFSSGEILLLPLLLVLLMSTGILLPPDDPLAPPPDAPLAPPAPLPLPDDSLLAPPDDSLLAPPDDSLLAPPGGLCGPICRGGGIAERGLF